MAESIQSDELLAEQGASGDRRALAGIFKRYQGELYRYCAALLGNSEDAADALQNTMIKVLGALPGERRRVNLRPWLYRIAHNESIELLRRRQQFDPIDAEALVGTDGPEASAETRERLRQLIADLGHLPERQRGALLMRELGGLSFEQIGAAFDTSAAVARQTVYEARIGLREMEKGREMGCCEVRRKLSDGDRRVFRRRDVRAHLRNCFACREFETTISDRRADLAAISPLPALVAAGLLKGVLGGAAASAGGSAAAAGAGAAGGAISGSVAVKAIATVAVVGAVGVGAADRTGMVPVFSGTEADVPAKAETRQAGGAPATGAAQQSAATEPSIADPAGAPASKALGESAPVGNGKAAHSPAQDANVSGPPEAGGRGPSAATVQKPGKAKAKGGGSVNAHGANPNAKGGNRGGAKPAGQPPAPVKAKSHEPPGQAKEPPGQAKEHEPPGQSEAGEPPAPGKPQS